MDKSVLKQKITLFEYELNWDGSGQYVNPRKILGRYETQSYVNIGGTVYSTGLNWKIWTSFLIDDDLQLTEELYNDSMNRFVIGWYDDYNDVPNSMILSAPLSTNIVPDLTGKTVIFEIGG